ncbi:MAG: copper chaperone PCu(A)C [Zoogloeaceae bacterium]|nr:copper chaperone PCu(A)C [Zoogloeaceae bacterium]
MRGFPVAASFLFTVRVLLCAGAAYSLSAAGSENAIKPEAPVKVSDAWARATVATQTASGVFMRLVAERDLTLTGASSPLAGEMEIHVTRVEDGMMKMRFVPELFLPAGQEITLKPGDAHLMLLRLSQPISVGQTLSVTLFFTDREGRRYELPVTLKARAHTQSAPALSPHSAH